MTCNLSFPLTLNDDENFDDAPKQVKPDKKMVAERRALALIATLVEVPVMSEEQITKLVTFLLFYRFFLKEIICFV